MNEPHFWACWSSWEKIPHVSCNHNEAVFRSGFPQLASVAADRCLQQPMLFFSPLWTDGQAEQDGTQQRVWSPAVAALPCIWSAGRMKRVGLTCDLAEQDIDHQNTKTQIPKTTTAEERSPWQHSREIAGPDYSGEWLTLCVLGFQLTAWQPETFLAHCNICTLAIA